MFKMKPLDENQTYTQDKCIIKCIDNKKEHHVEVLKFQPNNSLSVSLDSKIELDLLYNPENGLYTAQQGGLEFTSSGPSEGTNFTLRKR